MPLTSTCCVKFSPPTTTSPNPPSIPKTTQVLRPSKERWRRGCIEGMACVMIGLEISNWFTAGEGHAMIAAEEMGVISQSSIVNNNVSKWSDKRRCPPWHLNSLETIVPENLPRPSAHRRWEAVGFTKNAPAVKVVVTVKRTTNCFSM
ncbi:hypothetical protein HS088_TW04G00169 [Tripterygium wilfordii]|uniref:Uncharacterized protein n=1 Tax=Tripterygium wilfordii TaxID=458696 RepID=A0A7J7DPE3_TRIWF|nr:uncharacterized protein LOC119997586 [Tripterygium wilfordii]KAF5748218.1 hypothetical protein HS088_TW04G00169 [Tripterygium wilfordii]